MTEGQLIDKASQLQADVSWVQEYHDRWERIGRLCKAQLNMCLENKKGDPHAIDILNSTIEMAQTKVDKCAAFLKDKRPKLASLYREVFNDNPA